jgi:hypothetical protein
MAQRKAFLLRLDPAIYDQLQRWASGELRSLNGQIEYLLRRALQDAGRLPELGEAGAQEAGNDDEKTRASNNTEDET